MFHKRLLKEFNENMKYVIGMVATQWVSLLANVGMMLVMAVFLQELMTGGMMSRRVAVEDMQLLLIVFVMTFVIRMIAITVNSKQSFAASENVKRGLREKVYKKLMELGPSYRDTVTTAEAVQISTEGVDQLEIYSVNMYRSFFTVCWHR